MGRKVEIESDVVVYVGMKHLILMEGSVQDQDIRVHRYFKIDLPQGFQQGLVHQLGDAASSLQGLLSKMFPGDETPMISAWLVLGNLKLRQYSFQSSQYFQGDSRMISTHELRSVIQQTRSVATLPLSEYVLQTIPDAFLVDDISGVKNPIGLEARRLGVQLKIFTMNFQEFKNLSKVVDSSDLDVIGYVPKCLTLSEALVSDEEKKQGVIILDFTSENIELIFWKEGVLLNTGVIPLGGNQIDARLGERLNLDPFDTEKLKMMYGSFHAPQNPDELIPLVMREGRPSRQMKRSEFQKLFLETAEVWLTEALEGVNKFIESNGSQYPHFVVTGGGAAMDGLIEFLFKRYSLVARIGLAKHLEAPTELLVDPSMTHALGMFRWISTVYQEQKRIMQPAGFLRRTMESARDWFFAYF